MGIHKKKIKNPNFFNEDSMARWYLQGTLYSCLNYKGEKGFVYSHSETRLPELLKKHLKLEHEVQSSTKRNSHWLDPSYIPEELDESFLDMGLIAAKEDRKFPGDIPDHGLPHLIRGILDAQSFISKRGSDYVNIELDLDNEFLQDLHNLLVIHADVSRDDPAGNHMVYSKQDAIKIRDFIYQDWGRVYRRDLFLPSKRNKLMDIKIRHKEYSHVMVEQSKRKVELVKKYILEGFGLEDASKKAGYEHFPSACQSFKKQEEVTMKEWGDARGCVMDSQYAEKQARLERIKKDLLAGKRPVDISPDHGFNSLSSMYSFFHKNEGATLGYWTQCNVTKT